MNHLPLIIKREYLAKVKNKSFILMTFLSPLILVGLLSLVAYLTSVNNEKVRTIAVLDESGFLSETLVSTDQMIYENLSDISLEAAKKLSNKNSPLGWERFSKLASLFPGPSFALGGMNLNDLNEAKLYRAQGIAGIRSFFNLQND